MTEVAVLAERAGVIALAKPAGLATQAPPGIPSVEAWLRRRLSGGEHGGYVGIPHRLDRSVSGVLLMAATPRAARKLSRQFERREIHKSYLAIAGHPDVPAPAAELPRVGEGPATWRDTLEKIPNEPRARIVGGPDGAGREAVTRARLRGLDHEAAQFFLELQPLTGRMHQLRLQAASRGLPIVGDELYGGSPLAAAAAREPRARPILLHAWRITYADPDSAAVVTVEAPLPDYWPAWARASLQPAAG